MAHVSHQLADRPPKHVTIRGLLERPDRLASLIVSAVSVAFNATQPPGPVNYRCDRCRC